MNKFIRLYSGCGIGFPWMGKGGFSIRAYRVKDRGLGIWLKHSHIGPALRIALWWTWEIEWFRFCPNYK